MGTMTALAPEIPAAPSTPTSHRDLGVPHFFLRNASWELLERFLADNSSRRMRLTYAKGEMFFMSPSPLHERLKGLLGRFVNTATEELGVPSCTMGSTTWVRSDASRGIESDESFYIASEPKVRGKTEFDLTRDPPPDLAIEIDVTHSPIDRPAIYAVLGVPEVWVFDGKTLKFLKLIDGRYESVSHSLSFPFVTPADVERYLAMMTSTDETTIVRAWRQWVREHGTPRP